MFPAIRLYSNLFFRTFFGAFFLVFISRYPPLDRLSLQFILYLFYFIFYLFHDHDFDLIHFIIFVSFLYINLEIPVSRSVKQPHSSPPTHTCRCWRASKLRRGRPVGTSRSVAASISKDVHSSSGGASSTRSKYVKILLGQLIKSGTCTILHGNRAMTIVNGRGENRRRTNASVFSS